MALHWFLELEKPMERSSFVAAAAETVHSVLGDWAQHWNWRTNPGIYSTNADVGTIAQVSHRTHYTWGRIDFANHSMNHCYYCLVVELESQD